MSKKPSKPVIAYTRRTPQGPVLSVSVDAAKLEDKPKRVRMPKDHHDFWISDKAGKMWLYQGHMPIGKYLTPKEARRLAAYLTNAAAWIEQQQNGGKRGK